MLTLFKRKALPTACLSRSCGFNPPIGPCAFIMIRIIIFLLIGVCILFCRRCSVTDLFYKIIFYDVSYVV